MHRLLPIQTNSWLWDRHYSIYWMVAGTLVLEIALEYATPPEYVFGYLYIGPILIASTRLGSSTTWQVTLIGGALTLLNLFFPKMELYTPATVANRLIAFMALLVTGWLSDRNHRYQETIAHQKAQLQAEQQFATMREDFVSTLTHDLKTPLLGAIETLNSLQMEQFGKITPAQKKVLEMMTRSHASSLQLVETVLDIYRNDTEGVKLHKKPVNLGAIAQEVILTLTNLASSRCVSVRVRYAQSDFPQALWVNGDPLQLQRVFTNLIMNGINHSPRGGKVEVVLESNSSQHKVLVKDSGSGITPEELPHLFERFYQGHSDRQTSGSGLGLYLSRQIIEAHGGTIWAENQVPKGAVFGFRTPAFFFET
jgi:two-component system, NarL family, sensor kinase